MKRIWLFAILTGCGLAAFAGAHFGPSLWKVKRKASYSHPPPWSTQYLKLRITPSKTRLLVMEPLFVQVQLENTSLGDIRLASRAAVRIQILRPGESRWHEWLDSSSLLKAMIPNICGGEFYPIDPVIVPAGQSVGSIHDVYRIWDPEKGELQYALNQPGRYVVRVELRVWSGPGPLKSFEESTIEVEEPRGKDQTALEYLKAAGPHGLPISQLIWGSGIPDLVRFGDMFQESIYAQYAAYTYGTSLGGDWSSDKLRCLKFLVHDGERPFPLRAEAAAALVRAHRELGDAEAERALRDWLQKHMPEEYLNGRRYSAGWRWLNRGQPLFRQD